MQVPTKPSLNEAIAAARECSLPKRKEAFTTLRLVLQDHARSSAGLVLSEGESYLNLFEDLTTLAHNDFVIYQKSAAVKTRQLAESRLALIAESVRLATEACVKRIKLRVVRHILYHVLEKLSPEGGEPSEALSLEYARCLRSLLSYRPHVEHLRASVLRASETSQNEWDHVLDYCIGDIERYVSGNAESSNPQGSANLSTGLSIRSSRSYGRGGTQSHHSKILSRQIAGEMIICVQSLLALPNLRVSKIFHNVAWVLTESLQVSSLTDNIYVAAFAAINHLLSRMRIEDIRFTESFTIHLVPTIAKLWTNAVPNLRDEILRCLIMLQPYLAKLTELEDQEESLGADLRLLAQTMEDDASQKVARYPLLLIDDLRLQLLKGVADRQHDVSTVLFRLLPRSKYAVYSWSFSSLLAFIHISLSNLESAEGRHGAPNGRQSRSAKRQRTMNSFEDLTSRLSIGPNPSRLCALQTFAFLSEQSDLSDALIISSLSQLFNTCTEKDETIASWSFLAIASLASQPSAESRNLAESWASAWQLASRALTSSTTCRAASYCLYVMLQMQLVPHASINEFLQTLTNSIDLYGPCLIADSVCMLLVAVMQLAGTFNAGTSARLTDSIAHWLSRTFVVRDFDPKVDTTGVDCYEMTDIITAVCACVGQAATQEFDHALPVWDLTASTWIRCEVEKELVQYLLLPTQTDVYQARSTSLDKLHVAKGTLNSTPRQSAEALVLTHLVNETTRRNDMWSGPFEERNHNMSIPAFRSLCKICCVAVYISSSLLFKDERKRKSLEEQGVQLLRNIIEHISRAQCTQDKVDVFLVTFSSAFSGLSRLNIQNASQDDFRLSKYEKLVCPIMTRGLDQRRYAEEHVNDDNPLDIGMLLESQNSGAGVSVKDPIDNIYGMDASHSAATARHTTALYAKAVAYMVDEDESSSERAQPSERFLDYVLSQPESVIFSCRSILSSLVTIGLRLTTHDTKQLVELFTNEVLPSYEYSKSDIAIGTFLDVMISVPAVWTNRDNIETYNIGLDAYDWCTSTMIQNGLASPGLQKRLAEWLLQICHADADYAESSDLPSPRTSLFHLLKNRDVSVHYFLADKIPDLFNLLVLSKHDAMFEDLQASLPAEAEWQEGIAMRLLFFSKLATAWHSLLRQCVYYLFETAGRIQDSSSHAAWCINKLASSLPLRSPQRLFAAFAPQLLHSWLENNPLSELPYAAFRYSSLNDLLLSNQTEICAQIMMRGANDGWDTLSRALRTLPDDILKKCFAKSLAYAIGRDITKPQVNTAQSIEQRIRDKVGSKDTYRALVLQHYPAILGNFYLTMQQDDLTDSWLEKRPMYAAAAESLNEMKQYSHSSRQLPPSQQPSFRSKYICDQIERLCRRVGIEPVQPWTASSFMLAVRMLLDSMDDSLGSLHACLVIRRLRTLIAMSGKVAYTGLPLEILIHSLRPFLNDAECADDTLGILQYLFHRGKEYLQATPRYLLGSSILLVLHVAKHAWTEQDSVTLESQHRSTIQRMNKFRAWLADQLAEAMSGCLDFNLLFPALHQIQLPGNSREGSPEASLLLFLLKNWRAKDALCSKEDCAEALSVLAVNFSSPANAHEDILRQDKLALEYSSQLQDILLCNAPDTSFTAWAARALGRAYAASGSPPSKMIEEHPTASSAVIIASRPEDAMNSSFMIITRLVDLVYSRDRTEAGLADFTLRTIVASFNDPADGLAFEQLLPEIVSTSILGGSYGYRPNRASDMTPGKVLSLEEALKAPLASSVDSWAVNFALAACAKAHGIPIVEALGSVLQAISGLALQLLPFVIHILLAKEQGKKTAIRQLLSEAITVHLHSTDASSGPIQSFFIKLLSYLRSQPYPGEATMMDRLQWISIDLRLVASVAIHRGMPHAALVFAELSTPTASTSRRVSTQRSTSDDPNSTYALNALLLETFQQIDEPDSFYGVQQAPSLDAVLARFDHEFNGDRSLMFRSARLDSQMQCHHQLPESDADGLIKALSALNLHSLTYALVSKGFGESADSADAMLVAAKSLQQWDIDSARSQQRPPAITFGFFQDLQRASDLPMLQTKLQTAISYTIEGQLTAIKTASSGGPWHQALAILSEAADLLSVQSESDLQSQWQVLQTRQQWMKVGKYDDVNAILSSRQTALAVLMDNTSIQQAMHLSQRRLLNLYTESLLDVSKFAREQTRLQEALTATTSLNTAVSRCQDIGLIVDAAVKAETASVLWDAGEATTSVALLQDAIEMFDTAPQDISVGRAGLLAQLAHQLAEARLEKPEVILSKYLRPAIESLNGRWEGAEASRVCFEFASFCDGELQNPAGIENFNRVEKLRNRKADEIAELKEGVKASSKGTREREEYERSLRKANQWFAIDDAEYNRLKHARDMNVQQSLQNYLLALQASDNHDISVLRFFALWLDNAEHVSAASIVDECLSNVPSWKFVLLMNQLMSSLEHENTAFQMTLRRLLLRICSEHPHHSLHHLFASSRRPDSMDLTARSRYNAAKSIVSETQKSSRAGSVLRHVFSADKDYDELACSGKVEKGRTRENVKNFAPASKVATNIPRLRVPPATITLALRPGCDYDDIPIVVRFSSTFDIMSGLSAPKALKATASDGQIYKQLFKSGNDDLRQDAIMEQVFEGVSKMLRNHKATRQRDLKVRTYKVIPLSTNSGIIEFVPNSIPLNEFLRPAHKMYHPKDCSDSRARDEIRAVQHESTESRVGAYRKVCASMQPVLRHFFFERFDDPDEWFERRTAYTRTTASVSMLGHVLGLGDRHCHNILLDERTGEVVHIDLGVAFEAGRVLPIPELVPFRLTRDIIDGMGITKTEGVFRRCCEFTMDALRADKDSIMTLLNVLRYDPLYNWTVSPLRAKHMQDAQETGREADGSSRRKGDDAGEADRALSVVEKKLGKTLSTAAAVNELIQQATDERNLATLFCGWAAYF